MPAFDPRWSEASLHQTALDALRTRTLIRLPYSGGDASRVRTRLDREPELPPNEAIARLVDASWDANGQGLFDAALMGVTDVSAAEDGLALSCRPIRYRDYLATDQVLGAQPDYPFPLAVGVHAILSCANGIICLRLNNGRIALPGGAVDAQDLADAPGQALVHAAGREVAEETGIDLQGRAVQLTGLYVGGYPTHILAMPWADLSDAEGIINGFRPDDALDQVQSIELRPLDDLTGTMSDLPLVMRAALRSLRHWQGAEPAWAIATKA